MYGFIHCALADLVITCFGEDKWREIIEISGIELHGGSFMIHKSYNDSDTFSLFSAACSVLDFDLDECLEAFGEHFFRYCVEAGYDRILRVLGSSLQDFLANLDALHDHLASIYPGMRAPSFRCTFTDKGSLLLHYHSERLGLQSIVKGLIKTVAKELFKTNVSVEIKSMIGEESDHVVFEIIEIPQHKEDDSPASRRASPLLPEHCLACTESIDPRDLSMSVKTFCKAFPFHFMFDKKMCIIQAGQSLQRLLHKYYSKSKSLTFSECFKISRPVIDESFESILNHSNTMFVVTSRHAVIDFSLVEESYVDSDGEEITLRLKGQMLYVPESESILFLCSPRVSSVEDLKKRGLYFSDIPIHDTTRDLILMSYARKGERELVEKLEETSNALQILEDRLRDDKQQTDDLLYSILPSNVAEKLRANQTVEAEKFQLVTILFSDIVGFTAMCGNDNVVPMDIVKLLNKLYTHFDMLSNVHEIYKVETIGDAYMVVGGLPNFVKTHADRVLCMGIGMIDVTKEVLSPVDDEPIKIRVGIHSGKVMAGVVGRKMPRYCLFGNTVTTANKMESCGLPGRINISEESRSYLVCECYDFHRNKTNAANDLPLKCYFATLNLNMTLSDVDFAIFDDEELVDDVLMSPDKIDGFTDTLPIFHKFPGLDQKPPIKVPVIQVTPTNAINPQDRKISTDEKMEHYRRMEEQLRKQLLNAEEEQKKSLYQTRGRRKSHIFPTEFCSGYLRESQENLSQDFENQDQLTMLAQIKVRDRWKQRHKSVSGIDIKELLSLTLTPLKAKDPTGRTNLPMCFMSTTSTREQLDSVSRKSSSSSSSRVTGSESMSDMDCDFEGENSNEFDQVPENRTTRNVFERNVTDPEPYFIRRQRRCGRVENADILQIVITSEDGEEDVSSTCNLSGFNQKDSVFTNETTDKIPPSKRDQNANRSRQSIPDMNDL